MTRPDRFSANGAGGSGKPTPPKPMATPTTDPETLALLRARYRPPAPDSAFVARLEEDLMSNAPSIPIAAPSPLHQPHSTGQFAPRSFAPGAWLATAALLVLTLAAAFVALGPSRSSTPVIAPAATTATPAAGSIAAFVWETAGDPDNPLLNVGHLAFDPAGNLWVADPGNNRFQILSPDGAFLEAWGTAGSGDGQFSFRDPFPDAAIAFAPDGSFYVADPGNERVQKFAPDRSFVTAWGSAGDESTRPSFPSNLAVGADGRVYVIDELRHELQIFDPDGRHLRTIGGQGSGEGQFLFSSGGEVAVDPSGNVWVSDTSNRRLQVFTADGDLVAVWPGGADADRLGTPYQVAFDDAGRVFVATDAPREVQVFTADGEFLGSWGESDAAALTRIDLEPGTLLSPIGVAIDGAGNIYVSDIFRDRVVKFRLLPVLASTPIS